MCILWRIYCCINFVFCQEKSKSIPEEGSQASDDSVMLKIADHDSWQNNEVNLLDAHLGEDWVTAANQLDINRELEKCRELLRVQYNLNSVYKKEVNLTCFPLNCYWNAYVGYNYHGAESFSES